MKILINKYSELTTQSKPTHITVSSLQEASSLVKQQSVLQGSTQWYKLRNVGYVKENNKVIAHVSYNGRIWAVDKLGKFTDVEIATI